MESFSADWLALREPADHAARADDITSVVAERLARQPLTSAVDIGGGTGSNIRYLLPRLPRITHWTLVDHDTALLSVARATIAPLAGARGVTLETVRMDLADIEGLPLNGCALVTASALLDLVSPDWMQRFARRCREARIIVLCALSYDGRIEFDPPDTDDGRLRELVNRHQRTDKGFGAALGPVAVTSATRTLGGETLVRPSDWRLGPDRAELQRQLVEGWVSAASGMAPAEASRLDAWRSRRIALIAEGRSRITVGHLDFAAFPG